MKNYSSKKLSIVELLVLTMIVLIVSLILFKGSCIPKPNNYRWDPITGTQRWTEPDGREMIKGPDGRIQELSPRKMKTVVR